MQGPHIILIVLGDHFVPADDQILCKKDELLNFEGVSTPKHPASYVLEND